MGQDDQQPIKCDGCDIILSQIEPDETVPSRCLHWGQPKDYWSVELHFWEKDSYYREGDKESEHREPENYRLCNKCKKQVCDTLGRR